MAGLDEVLEAGLAATAAACRWMAAGGGVTLGSRPAGLCDAACAICCGAPNSFANLQAVRSTSVLARA